MAGITLDQAEEKLQTWLDAENALATSQSYTVRGRTLTRADLREIGDRIDFWEKKVNRLSRGGIRIRGVTPI